MAHYYTSEDGNIDARFFLTNNEPDDLNMRAMVNWIESLGGQGRHDGTSIFIGPNDEMIAGVGDWIVSEGGSFSVLSADEFAARFPDA